MEASQNDITAPGRAAIYTEKDNSCANNRKSKTCFSQTLSGSEFNDCSDKACLSEVLGEREHFTQVPNSILDFWLPKLSPTQFKILMVICRKTHGWQKQEDKISLAQMQKASGLSRPAVIKAIGQLTHFGLIVKTNSKSGEGDEAPSSYRIKGGSKFPLPSSKQNLPGVVNEVNCGSKQDLPTKESFIKERATKKDSPKELQLSFGSFVKLTEIEYAKLCNEFGKGKIDNVIDSMNDWLEAKGLGDKKYKNYSAAVRIWAKKASSNAGNIKAAPASLSRHTGLSKDNSQVDQSRIFDFSGNGES